MIDFPKTALPRPLLLFVTLPLMVLTSAIASDEPNFDTTTDAMRRETQWVINRLAQYHYSKKTISRLDLEEFLINYISDLDYNRIYFLQEDIESFRFRFGSNMKGWLTRGDLYPAFQIFKRYRERALNRIDWVMDRIQGDFNFADDEAYTFDRSELDWPANEAEADTLWSLRLEYELLNELMPMIAKVIEEEIETAETTELSETMEKALRSDPYQILNRADFQPKREEAISNVSRRYERWRKNLLEIEPEYVQERYLTTLTNLYDPHSTFLSADSLDDFAMAMRNSFVGIGAILQDDDGYCTIRELLPGGPAEQSRLLRSGDVILGVAQGAGDMEDVVDMNLRKIVKLIKGKQGSEVRLLIRPSNSADPSNRKVISLIRDEIQLTANLATASVFEVPLENETVPVGVIDLPSFYGGNGSEVASTTDDVEELIGKLEDIGVAGLVLDLRRNGGGLLNEAVDLTGLFIPEGPVVQVRDTLGRVDSRSDKNPKVAWEGPLMVLVSRYSASASEIVAGALKNHQRALIVGDSTTHGKGTVQAILEPNNNSFFTQLATERSGAAKITIQKFYLPNGDSTQKMGVSSDIVIPSINEFLPIGESDLDNALVWDTIEPLPLPYKDRYSTNFIPLDTVLIKELKSKSELRQANLPEFDYLNRSIDYYRNLREQKEISLNLAERKDQGEQEKAFNKAMLDELRDLAKGNYSFEEILLDLRLEQEKESEELQSIVADEPVLPYEIDPDMVLDADASLPEVVENNEVLAQENTEESDEIEDETPEFDIHLREGLRIMGDWIAWERGYEQASTSTLTVKADTLEKDKSEDGI